MRKGSRVPTLLCPLAGIVQSDPLLPVDRTLIPSPPPRPKNPVFDDEEKSKVRCTGAVGPRVRAGLAPPRELAARAFTSVPPLPAFSQVVEEQEPRRPAGGQQAHQVHGEGGEWEAWGRRRCDPRAEAPCPVPGPPLGGGGREFLGEQE